MADGDIQSGRDLVADLRELAASSGLPQDQLQSIMRRLMPSVVELGELRAAAPAKARRLALAGRVHDAQRSGASIQELCLRFGRQRTQIYALLSLSGRITGRKRVSLDSNQ
jgi:hypothetical protein